MAKWKSTAGFTSGGTLRGAVDYDGTYKGESRWQIYQDERPFIEQAKLDRELGTRGTNTGYKKFATIPDIVAIEVNEKYGIDVHDPATIGDRDKMTRFKRIIQQEYKHLLSF